jgi:hypothetical protein
VCPTGTFASGLRGCFVIRVLVRRDDGPIGVVEDGAWESVHALEGGTVIAEADCGGDAFVDGFVSDIGGVRGADGECIGGEVKGGDDNKRKRTTISD